MFYFTEDVIQLKAWQLYLGNGFWTLFVGLVLMIIAKILGMAGIDSHTVRNLLNETRVFTHAQSPQQIRGYGNAVGQAPTLTTTSAPSIPNIQNNEYQ